MSTPLRRVAGAVLSLAIASGSFAPVAHAAPTVTPAASPVTRTFTLPELVKAVPVATPMFVGFAGTSQFIPAATAAKKDARGCNLKQRTIINLATVKPKVGKGCKMSGGKWVVDNGTKTVTSIKGLTLVPTMPYKMAWGQGAYAWTPAQRTAWATSTGVNGKQSRSGVTDVSGRAGAVVTQATQTLISPSFWREVRAAVESDNDKYMKLFDSVAMPCIFGANKPAMDCISLMLFVYSWTGGASATTASCNGLIQSAANLKAWGLSVPNVSNWNTLEAVDECVHGPLVEAPRLSVTDMSAIHGISPITSPSAAPATFVPASQPLFDGYAAPVTDPATNLFGMLAPADWGDPQVPVDSLRLWDAGVSWRQIEKAPGVYDWSTMDRTIAMAQRLGARVQYVLGDTPAWANQDNAGNVPPDNNADAAAFITNLCLRYQGSIAQYEVWNEGNIVDFWSGTPQQLADLTSAVYDAVQQCFPSATVIASSAGARATGGLANRYMPYLQALRAKADANGGQWPIEAVEVHSYPAANGTPVDRVAILKQWSAMLDANGVPTSFPRFDGELNYGLAGLGQGRIAIPEGIGAGWLAQSYIQSMQYGIQTLHWFLWTGARGDYDKLGIQFNNGTSLVKEAWEKTRDWLYGARMQRCAQRDNLIACQLTGRDGANFTVAWSIDGNLAYIDPTGLGTQVCLLLAGCSPLNGNTKYPVSEHPIKIS